jgi:molybdenum cofactor cytidylyltransferase
MTSKRKKTAIILLAAGNSSRLGRPKQLLKWQSGLTLLEHMVTVALQTQCQPVVVVLGSHFELLHQLIENQQVCVVKNETPESGIGSSIAVGFTHLQNHFPEVDSAVILLCDQPLVNARTLEQLIHEHKQSEKSIIVSKYGEGNIGPPVLFDKKHFKDLSKLTGDQGAKALIRSFPKEIGYVKFQEGYIDVDTEEDWASFVKNHNK